MISSDGDPRDWLHLIVQLSAQGFAGALVKLGRRRGK